MADDRDPGDHAGVQVTGFDRTGGEVAELGRLVELARATLIGEGVTAGDLDLIAVDTEEMAALNAEHMGHEGPTDVLSFPLDADDPLAGLGPHSMTDAMAATGTAGPRGPAGGTGPPLHLGDVVVCPEVARRQAPDHAGSEEAELSLLVIHGVLHVLGHDHDRPDDAAIMQARERRHLAALGFAHPGSQAASC